MPFSVHPSRIDAAERALGARFPSSYREGVARANGGSVEALDDDWSLFPVLDDTDDRRLSRTCNDVVRETLEARRWPNFPADAVAVASNGTGDFLILRPMIPGELGDTVYWFDHETGEVHPVGESFASLPRQEG